MNSSTSVESSKWEGAPTVARDRQFIVKWETPTAQEKKDGYPPIFARIRHKQENAIVIPKCKDRSKLKPGQQIICTISKYGGKIERTGILIYYIQVFPIKTPDASQENSREMALVKIVCQRNHFSINSENNTVITLYDPTVASWVLKRLNALSKNDPSRSWAKTTSDQIRANGKLPPVEQEEVVAEIKKITISDHLI